MTQLLLTSPFGEYSVRNPIYRRLKYNLHIAEVALSAWLLIENLGSAAIFGLVLPILLIPPQRYLLRNISKTQADVNRATDARVAAAAEVLSSIKHVKLMAHETAYSEKILKARQKELKCMWRNKIAKSWLDCLSVVGPAFTLFFSLLWYTKVQHRLLTAPVAFSSIVITEQMRTTYTVRLMSVNNAGKMANPPTYRSSITVLEYGFNT